MNWERAFDRDEEQLAADLTDGLITRTEYDAQLRQLLRDRRDLERQWHEDEMAVLDAEIRWRI